MASHTWSMHGLLYTCANYNMIDTINIKKEETDVKENKIICTTAKPSLKVRNPK